MSPFRLLGPSHGNLSQSQCNSIHHSDRKYPPHQNCVSTLRKWPTRSGRTVRACHIAVTAVTVSVLTDPLRPRLTRQRSQVGRQGQVRPRHTVRGDYSHLRGGNIKGLGSFCRLTGSLRNYFFEQVLGDLKRCRAIIANQVNNEYV